LQLLKNWSKKTSEMPHPKKGEQKVFLLEGIHARKARKKRKYAINRRVASNDPSGGDAKSESGLTKKLTGACERKKKRILILKPSGIAKRLAT